MIFTVTCICAGELCLLSVFLRQLARHLVVITGRDPLPQRGAGGVVVPDVPGELVVLVVVHVTAEPLII